MQWLISAVSIRRINIKKNNINISSLGIDHLSKGVNRIERMPYGWPSRGWHVRFGRSMTTTTDIVRPVYVCDVCQKKNRGEKGCTRTFQSNICRSCHIHIRRYTTHLTLQKKYQPFYRYILIYRLRFKTRQYNNRITIVIIPVVQTRPYNDPKKKQISVLNILIDSSVIRLKSIIFI